MLTGAAGSTAPEATSKMEWVLANAPAACDRGTVLSHACGAAAASGDLARVRWLREGGFDWGAPVGLAAVLEHAELGFLQRLEAEGGHLPAANHVAWHCSSVVSAAAASPSGSEAKLQWLAGRGASHASALDAMCKAAGHGNLAALELLVQHWRGGALPDHALFCAAAAGSIATASWLRQAGCTLTRSAFRQAFSRADLPMVRWLLEAGCPQQASNTLAAAVSLWPKDTAANGQRLVEAMQMLAAAGWPMGATDEQLYTLAASAGHPWAVWHGLRHVVKRQSVAVPRGAAALAATAGCQATLEALVGMGLRDGALHDEGLLEAWYADAAKNGDRGTLAWLRQQGMPWHGVVMEAATKGAPLAALRWLVEQGAIVNNIEIMHVRHVIGNASSPLHYRMQRDVKAWLLDCFRRWIFNVCLASVWALCLLVVTSVTLDSLTRGQHGFWAFPTVFVLLLVVMVFTSALLNVTVYVAHAQDVGTIMLHISSLVRQFK